ncbi:MAG: hypothetical protein HC792_01550 [Acaryochloridaceae cyanobacterium CSU_5_19]|nr:hypothetical protein [Acaryochloridaceae cyanobacterium CSU_5_19]
MIQGDQLSPWTEIQQVLSQQDEPLFACNLHLTRALYKVAQAKQVRVILDGFDGDMAVSHGVGYLRELARAGHWLKLAQEMQGFALSFNYAFPQLYWSYLYRYGLRPILKRTKLLKVLPKIQKIKQNSFGTKTKTRAEASPLGPSPYSQPLPKKFTCESAINSYTKPVLAPANANAKSITRMSPLV